MSDIDGPLDKRDKRPKVNSVVVKLIESKTPTNSSYVPSHGKPSHRLTENFRRTQNHVPFKPTGYHHKPNSRKRVAEVHLTSQSAVVPTTKFVARGTQTERTGPCKCARALKSRNQRKRAENKINKEIVETLERVNVIQFKN